MLINHSMDAHRPIPIYMKIRVPFRRTIILASFQNLHFEINFQMRPLFPIHSMILLDGWSDEKGSKRLETNLTVRFDDGTLKRTNTTTVGAK